ncbi:hypothetical protein M378DRAFT_16732 [Amanita muscaria Koide BX008]|uniref:Uncharacterized protein n=1 Tax=Amanita muscaria (strain Koide BX008) TaxID=946122 RepID=A0A0C2S2F4_AMAMK|nr:hypothetical protein M378DRAFT_16732 [Amanita muscaria Koide BX008]
MEEKRKAKEEEQRLREEAEQKAKEEEEKKKQEEEERWVAEEERQWELAAAKLKQQQEAERVLQFQRGTSASSSAKKQKLMEEDEADAEETDEEEDSDVMLRKVVLGEPLEKDCDQCLKGQNQCKTIKQGCMDDRVKAKKVLAKAKRGAKGKKKSKFVDGSLYTIGNCVRYLRF